MKWTLRGFINTDHIEFECGLASLLPSNGKRCIVTKRPRKSQKAGAFWTGVGKTMIQLAKKTFLERTCSLRKKCEVAWRLPARAGLCQDFAKGVGRAPLGRRLALPGPMGQCALAQHPPVGTSWRSVGRVASSFSSTSRQQEGVGGGFVRRARPTHLSLRKRSRRVR